MTYYFSTPSSRQWNRRLTKAILKRLGHVPHNGEHTPLMTALSHIPGVDAVVDLIELPSTLADLYQSMVVANARALRRQRKLSVPARQALERYEQALVEEQRAYNAMAKMFDKDPPY